MDSGVGPDEYSKQIFTVTSYEQTKIQEIQETMPLPISMTMRYIHAVSATRKPYLH